MLLLLWAGWVAVFNAGTANGFGYFHQPEHNLLWPLVNGALFNAALFLAMVWCLVPRYLAKKRYAAFAMAVGTVALGYLVLKTLAERLIIVLDMPSLADISLFQLGLENVYTLIAFVILGVLYRVSRDWLTGSGPGHAITQNRPVEDAESILLKSGTRTHRMTIKDIQYVKSEGNYVVFDDGARRILTYMTMAQVMEKLPVSLFVRVHRSYIAGIAHIDVIEKNHLKVGSVEIPIGAKYRSECLSRIDQSF